MSHLNCVVSTLSDQSGCRIQQRCGIIEDEHGFKTVNKSVSSQSVVLLKKCFQRFRDEAFHCRYEKDVKNAPEIEMSPIVFLFFSPACCGKNIKERAFV